MMLQNKQELAHMKSQNIDPEEIEKRKSDINTRAKAMYLAVAAFTKTGLWDNKEDLTPMV
jgi:hypothetical protein